MKNAFVISRIIEHKKEILEVVTSLEEAKIFTNEYISINGYYSLYCKIINPEFDINKFNIIDNESVIYLSKEKINSTKNHLISLNEINFFYREEFHGINLIEAKENFASNFIFTNDLDNIYHEFNRYFYYELSEIEILEAQKAFIKQIVYSI